MEIRCIFLFLAAAQLSYSYQLPSDIEKCKFSDGKCLNNFLNYLIKHYGKSGVADINVPPLESVKVPDVSVVQDDKKKAIWYQVKARNIIVNGLENTTFTKVKTNWEKKSIDIYGRIPRLAAKLDYSLKTRVIAFALNTTGHGTSEVQNFQFILKSNLVLDNRGFLKLYELDVSTKIDRAIFDLTYVDADNTDLAIVLNQMLNENWREIWPEVKPTFETMLRENFIVTANSILATVKFEDLFLAEDAF